MVKTAELPTRYGDGRYAFTALAIATMHLPFFSRNGGRPLFFCAKDNGRTAYRRCAGITPPGAYHEYLSSLSASYYSYSLLYMPTIALSNSVAYQMSDLGNSSL